MKTGGCPYLAAFESYDGSYRARAGRRRHMAVVSQTPPGTGDGAWQRPAPDAWWGKESFNRVPPPCVPPRALLLEVCSGQRRDPLFDKPRESAPFGLVRREKTPNGQSTLVPLAIRRDVWGAHALRVDVRHFVRWGGQGTVSLG